LFVVLVVIAMRVARVIASRSSAVLWRAAKDNPEFKKRADTLESVVRYSLSVVILVVTAMTILREVGIEIGPLLAAAGVVGLAVGFGAQNLVQDVISGSFILSDD
jgi:small conductance mechanosensitive channel